MLSFANHVFYSKTYESDAIKHLLELLACNLTTSHITLNLSSDGIGISCCTEDHQMMFDVFMEAKNFNAYHCTQPCRVGVPLQDLRDISKYIKNRCAVQIAIEDSALDVLHIVVGQRGGISRSIKMITDIQTFTVEHTLIFPVFHVLPSLEFYKVCKGIRLIDDKVVFCSFDDRIEIQLGSTQSNLVNTSYVEAPRHVLDPTQPIPDLKLRVDRITSLSRLGKLHTILRIGMREHYVRFETRVGALGTLCVYINAHVQK